MRKLLHVRTVILLLLFLLPLGLCAQENGIDAERFVMSAEPSMNDEQMVCGMADVESSVEACDSSIAECLFLIASFQLSEDYSDDFLLEDVIAVEEDGSPQQYTYYVGDMEGYKVGPSDPVWFYHIGHGVVLRKVGNAVTTYYAFTDNLGSIMRLYNSSGTAVFSAYYDPWGVQTVSTNTIGFNRGYCGHEMLNDLQLINMNGRFYDPYMARFLSPDNYVQMPTSAQSFNRYSYCLNNPLKYVDQDGELFGIDDFVIAMALYNAANSMIQAAYFGKSVWKAGALSLLSSAATYGIGSAFGSVGSFGHEVLRAGAHGVATGGINVLNGGSFGSGFTSGALSSGIGSFAQGIHMNTELMVTSTTAMGALGYWATGGDVLEGAMQGLQIGVYNHGMHGEGIITYSKDSKGNYTGSIPEVVIIGHANPSGCASLGIAAAINSIGHIISRDVRRGNNGKLYYRHANGKIFNGNQYVRTNALKSLPHAGSLGMLTDIIYQTPEVLYAYNTYGPQSRELQRALAVAGGRVAGGRVGQQLGKVGGGALAGGLASYFTLGTLSGPVFVGGEIIGTIGGNWAGSNIGGWVSGMMFDLTY